MRPDIRLAGVIEQIAQNHHQAPLTNPLGQVVKDRAQCRLAGRNRVLHDVDEFLQVSRLAGRRRNCVTDVLNVASPTASCCRMTRWAIAAATYSAYSSFETAAPRER